MNKTDSLFRQLGATNHSPGEREENDFYATDPKAIDDLLNKISFDKNIWEPACGQGHLSQRLKEHGYSVFSTDIIDRGYSDDNLDFLMCWEDWDGDIITNPPYKLCTEFVLKALDLIGPGHKVAMFFKIQFLEGQDRYEKIFKNYPPKYIYIYSRRIQCAKNGNFSEFSSSAICYAWFVWEKGYQGKPEIDWIN